MRAGYGLDVYRRLCEARAQITGKELSWPFVSVAGPNYASAPCKLLYVGKSLDAGEDEGEAPGELHDFASSLAWSSYWLGRQSTPSTAFWRFGVELVRTVMPDATHPPTTYLAWSNLAKIAQVGLGAPDRAVCAAMHDADCAALDFEIRAFQPDLVVLVSNDAVWDVATATFGDRHTMTVHADKTWTRNHPRGFKLYWTRHPQGESVQWRAEHARRIASLLGSPS